MEDEPSPPRRRLLAVIRCVSLCVSYFCVFSTHTAQRPTSCSWVFSGACSGLLRARLGEGDAGFRKSSSAESELDMASLGFSVSPAAEKTTITLGSGSVRLSWMKRLTRVVAAGSGLKDRD